MKEDSSRVFFLTPPQEWDIESFEYNPVNEGLRRLSLAHCSFYRGFVDKLVNGEDISIEGLGSLLGELHPLVRNRYLSACEQVRVELNTNHKLIEGISSYPVEYLLSGLVSADKIGIERAQLLVDIGKNADKCTFLEPTPGLAIILVGDNYYDVLRKQGIVSENSVGVFHDRHEDVSFSIVDNSRGEEKSAIVQFHEASHFVMDVLEKNGLVPKPNDRRTNLRHSFGLFRNELVSYLSAGDEIRFRPHTHFIYDTETEESVAWANTAITFIDQCLQIAEQRNVDQGIYLYSAMRSKNFSHLMENLTRVTQWVR